MKLLLLFFFNLLSLSTFAAEPKKEGDNPSAKDINYYNKMMFMISHEDGSACTGINIGKYALTAQHCLQTAEDCKKIKINFTSFEKNFRCEKIIYTNKENEMVVFSIKEGDNLPFMEIEWGYQDNPFPYYVWSKKRLSPLTPLTVKYCFLDLNYKIKDFTFRTVSDNKGKEVQRFGKALEHCSEPSYYGDSGSPVVIWDETKEVYRLTGVIWGISSVKGSQRRDDVRDTYFSSLDSSLEPWIKKLIKKDQASKKINHLN